VPPVDLVRSRLDELDSLGASQGIVETRTGSVTFQFCTPSFFPRANIHRDAERGQDCAFR
jgi:hypothetical protein